MKLTQVKGNTWVAEAHQFIPFYRLKDGRCILLDSGLPHEREDLERSLLDAGLTPAAILGSHIHVDHAANHAYFQKKYALPVAVTAAEAGMCADVLNLKCYASLISPAVVREEKGEMPFTPDLVLPNADSQPTLLGVKFRCIYTPGHSTGHICIVTPDNVCYVGDVLFSPEALDAKLPYCLDHARDLMSKERLRGLDCDAFIAAHRGVFTDVNAMVDSNRELVHRRAAEILSVIDRPMSFSQINAGVCRYFGLEPHTPRRALAFEVNTRFFVEYLLDRGDLALSVADGVVHYAPLSL